MEPDRRRRRSAWGLYAAGVAFVLAAAAVYLWTDALLAGKVKSYSGGPRLSAEHARLAARLDSQELGERTAALREIEALGASGAALAERVAMELLAPEAEEAECAIDALAAMGPDVAPFLWPYVCSSERTTRVRAGTAFHRMGPEGVDRLVALWEERAGFDHYAWDALEACGSDAVSRLVGKLGADEAVSQRAAMALAQMSTVARSSAQQIAKLLDRRSTGGARPGAASALLGVEGDTPRQSVAILSDPTHPGTPPLLAAALELQHIPPEVAAAAARLAMSGEEEVSTQACLVVCAAGEAPPDLLAAAADWLGSSEVTRQEQALIVFVGVGAPTSCLGRVAELAGRPQDEGIAYVARLALVSSGGLRGVKAFTALNDARSHRGRLECEKWLTTPFLQSVLVAACERRLARTLRDDPTLLLETDDHAIWMAFDQELQAHPRGATEVVARLYEAAEARGLTDRIRGRPTIEALRPTGRKLDLSAAATALQSNPTGLAGNPELADESVPRLRSDDPAERLAAALNLIAAGREEGVVEAVLELLSHPDGIVREVAGGVLAVAAEDSVPDLVAMLEGATGDYLVAVIRALGKQRDRCGPAMGALGRLAQHEDAKVRSEVEMALWWIGLLSDSAPQPPPESPATSNSMASVWPLTPARLREILRRGPPEIGAPMTDEMFALYALGGIPRECMDDALAYCLADGGGAPHVMRALLQSPGDHTRVALRLAGCGQSQYHFTLEYLDAHLTEALEHAWVGLGSRNKHMRLGCARYLMERGVMEDQARARVVLTELARSSDPMVSEIATQVLSMHAAPTLPPSGSPPVIEQMRDWLDKLGLRLP